MHPLAIYLLLFPIAAQADLYKCTDNSGKVTYSNSSCTKAGLKQAKLIPPPPPPAVNAATKASKEQSNQQAKPATDKIAAAPKARETASVQLMKSSSGKDGMCAKLNNDMGRTMDEMDAARDQGYSARQQAEWSDSLQKLQSEKNRLGCF